MILPDCLILDYRDLSENYLKQQRIPKVGSSFSGLPAPFGFAPQIRTFVSSTPLTIWPRHLIPFYCGRQAPLPFWCHISHSKDHFKMCLDPDLLCREPIKTTVCYSGPLALGNLQLVSALNSNSPTIFSHKPKHVVSLSRYAAYQPHLEYLIQVRFILLRPLRPRNSRERSVREFRHFSLTNSPPPSSLYIMCNGLLRLGRAYIGRDCFAYFGLCHAVDS